MIRRAKTFVQNHWRKLILGGIAVHVAQYGIRYATNRFITYQEDQAKMFWKKVKKQQHFESIEENAMATYRQLVELMKISIDETLNAEILLEGLKNNQVVDKLAAWEELKLLAFSRVISTIYGTSLLYVLLRIQLSVIGGYLIIESNNGKNATPITEALLTDVTSTDEDVQRKYLALSKRFATVGVSKICHLIQQKVKNVVSKMPLKQPISANDLEEMFWSIIRNSSTPEEIEAGTAAGAPRLGNPSRCSWKFIFPDELLSDFERFKDSQQSILGTPDMYTKLLCETYDLLESDDCRGILSFFESHGVSHFVDRLSDCIREVYVDKSDDEHTEFTEPTVPLAKLIPPMNALQLVDVLDDPWLHLLMNSDSVRVLSANIYEAFSVDAL